jgi:hypothetical protein
MQDECQLAVGGISVSLCQKRIKAFETDVKRMPFPIKISQNDIR